MNNINSAGLLRGSAFALALMLSVGSAAAQDYPSRPVTAIVPFAGGSASDVVSRILFDKMSKLMGQPIIVENRPGAGTVIGASYVAKAEPDGYTVLVHSSSYTITPSTYPNAPYDTLRDLTGITPLAFLPQVVVISPGSAFPRCRISCAPRRQSRVR